MIKNFTTPEQSQRLLELGVPADSADCIYPCYKQEGYGDKLFMYGHINIKHPAGSRPKYFIPCWSVGRLIEIYVYLTSYEYVSLIFKKTFTPIDEILDKIEKDIKNGMLDFSKLEN